MSELTFGQKRVSYSFNPSENKKVESIKRKHAELIDELEAMKTSEHRSDKNRLINMAQTDLEVACMKAVKSIFT